MFKLLYKNNGSVTIFITIVLLPMLIFSFGVVDFAKAMMAYNATEQATTTALNSTMALYEKALKDAYGLFAASSNEKELADNLTDYYIATLAANGIKDANKTNVLAAMNNLIGTSLDGLDLTENDNFLKLMTSDDAISLKLVENTQLSNEKVLKRQMVDFMKYRGPIEMGKGIFAKLDMFKDLPKQASAATQKILFTKELGELGDSLEKYYIALKYYLVKLYEFSGTPHTRDENVANIVYITEKGEHKNEPLTETTTAPAYSGFIKGGWQPEFSEYGEKFSKYNGVQSYDQSTISWKSYYNNYLSFDLDIISNVVAALGAVRSELDANDNFYSRANEMAFNKRLNPTEIVNLLHRGNFDDFNYEDYDWVQTTDFVNKSNYFASAEKVLLDFQNNDVTFSEKPTQENLEKIHERSKIYYKYSVYNDSNKSNDLKKFVDEYEIFGMMIKAEDLLYDEIANLVLKQQYSQDPEEINSLEEEISRREIVYEPLIMAMVEKDHFRYGYMRNDLADLHSEVKDYTERYYDIHRELYKRIVNETKAFAECAKKLHTTYIKGGIERLHKELSLMHINLEYAVTALAYLTNDAHGELVESMEAAKNQANAWGKSNEDIQNKQMKAAGAAEHKSETELLLKVDEDELKALKVKLENRRGQLSKAVDLIKKVKLCDKELYKEKDIKKYQNDINVFKEPVISTEEVNQLPDDAPNYDEYKEDFESGDFFAFLKSACEKSKPSEEKVNEAKSIDAEATKAANKSQENTAAKTSGESSPSGSETKTRPNGDDNYSVFINDINETFGFEKADTEKEVETPPTMDNSQDKKKEAEKATEALDNDVIKNLGDLAADLAEGLRDNIYMTEYITENFSCQTSNLKNGEEVQDRSLTRKDINKENNYLMGTEVEYILYGFQSADDNRLAANASIFGLRFALNLIYSFTDGEINATTQSIATVLSAALPFLIPVVKVVLHVTLALAESSIDLIELLDGRSVPIYKTTRTWVCKTSNFMKKALSAVASKAVDTLTDKATDALIEKIASMEGKINESVVTGLKEVNELVDAQMESLQEDIRNTTFTNLNQIISKSVEACKGVVDNSEGRIKEEVTTAFDNVVKTAKDTIPTSEDGVFNKATAKALEVLDSKRDDIINKIAGNISKYTESINGMVDGTAENTLKIIDDIENDFNGVFESVKSQVANLRSEVSTAVTGAVTDFSKKAQGLSKEKIGELGDEFKQGISARISKIGGDANKTFTTGGGESGITDLLSMTYKDYLYIFLLLGTTANETNILQRTARVIQLNVNHMPEGNKDFKIGNSYTILEATGKSSIKTVFLGLVYENGGYKRKSGDLGLYNLSIKTRMGY